MGEFLNQIPVLVQDQLKDITKTSGLQNTEESVEMMAKAWIEKKEAFEDRIGSMKMEECDTLSKDEERGALVLTYSGSLISIGPLVNGVRTAEYTSIDLRGDVPRSAKKDDSSIGADVKIDAPLLFDKGPLKSSSPVFKIAMFTEDMSAAEEQKQIKKATVILTDDFAKINKTIILE